MLTLKVIQFFITNCFLCSYMGFKESKLCPFVKMSGLMSSD